MLPVGRGLLWLVLGQAQALAQGEAEGQVDHQVETEDADDRVFHRADLARRGVVGRGRPTDHLGGERRIGFHQAGDVVDAGVGVDPQLDDLLRRLRQRWNLDGLLQALLDAPGGEGLHGLADFRAVVVRAVKVQVDVFQRFAEARGAGLAQQAAEVVAGDLQEDAGLAGLDQQARFLQQALVVQAGRTGQGRQRRQAVQLVLAEHSFQALGLDRQQLAAGQFGEPGEVQQLALREQHQQGADGVVQQHRLDPAGGRQLRAVADLAAGDA